MTGQTESRCWFCDGAATSASGYAVTLHHDDAVRELPVEVPSCVECRHRLDEEVESHRAVARGCLWTLPLAVLPLAMVVAALIVGITTFAGAAWLCGSLVLGWVILARLARLTGRTCMNVTARALEYPAVADRLREGWYWQQQWKE
jgi:hypothetical protein